MCIPIFDFKKIRNWCRKCVKTIAKRLNVQKRKEKYVAESEVLKDNPFITYKTISLNCFGCTHINRFYVWCLRSTHVTRAHPPITTHIACSIRFVLIAWKRQSATSVGIFFPLNFWLFFCVNTLICSYSAYNREKKLRLFLSLSLPFLTVEFGIYHWNFEIF